ncbi:MAG: ABC transporter permease [Vicinamibacterales bacterium]|nr:peptide ABC transporter permease [Acidobacteriota bacterium]MDP7339454.1 ABC transporter permease [Vicinamibacterales bacterium]MDP7472873.1 ABC transporter permease [Vicinamibacterales bacterium]MDP7670536.1 ABC transporter permease [Vicinamibacterales bacterium]HJO38193.1 ABC transporter permease [Vicinamibacterales bacterium]
MSGRWLIRRLSTNAVVLFAALVVNFALPRLMPGSPVDRFAGGAKMSAEARDALIERFGLNAPLWDQFWRYLAGTLQADLGQSFAYFPQPVSELLLRALPWTLLLLVTSLVLQVGIGYLLGATSGWHAGSRLDAGLQTLSLIFFSTPLFWVAMVLLYVFGFQLGWLPLSGAFTIGLDAGLAVRVGDVARHAILPIASLTIAQYASYQIILRNNMVGVLQEQYMLMAEAKGLSDRTLKHTHAARNALLPVVTFLGVSLAMSLTGSVFVESVFSYPGLGKLMYDSVLSRDYPMLQGCFLMFSLVVVAANLLVDIAYWFLDPRITY